MGNEELMAFYAAEGNKEWLLIIKSKSYFEINPEDFVYSEFCMAASHYILTELLKRNLTSDHAENRYWAGLRLNQYRDINNKLLASWN